jgi:hypothetical protein
MRSFHVLLILATATAGLADTLYMKDGRVVAGTYLGGTTRQIRMEVGNQVEAYDITDVAKIEFQSAAASAPSSRDVRQREAPQREVEPPRERVRLLRPDPAGKPAPAPPASLTIPAGTVLKVRMIDSVDSEVSQLGQTFQASLDEPITGAGGETLVSRGADIVAKLVEDRQSGKISGKTELTLDLVSIRIGDRMVDLNTEEVTTSSESRTGKSAKVIGGTAALGAILGGIFGGGKGAAIGATTGAGAGTAVQVMTKGQRVRIPAETRLSFTLQNAVSI